MFWIRQRKVSSLLLKPAAVGQKPLTAIHLVSFVFAWRYGVLPRFVTLTCAISCPGNNCNASHHTTCVCECTHLAQMLPTRAVWHQHWPTVRSHSHRLCTRLFSERVCTIGGGLLCGEGRVRGAVVFMFMSVCMCGELSG